MGTLPHERELEIARRAVEEAGALIAAYAGEPPESWQKAEDQPVTRADLEANEAILRAIRRRFPDDAIRSEEQGQSGRQHGERVWLIDPLDGTKEFIAGIPEFAVSVALTVRGEPVAAAVYPPLTRECFWASQGGGAWLGERRIEVSRCARLQDATMIASRTEISRGQLAAQRAWFGQLQPLGSVALKLAWIAAGRGDVWLSVAAKNEWDVCGGDLLVREAGGVFSELGAQPRRYNLEDPLLLPPMAAGPRALVEQLRERCSK
jgi:myo-inositol-1(or 4)-monophosphatase